ncbi:MAG: hypothetical protein JJV98_10140, partial [Desulfosarcina sp.]|nr:hypothetical protein [Desulfobacterales bacterium]
MINKSSIIVIFLLLLGIGGGLAAFHPGSPWCPSAHAAAAYEGVDGLVLNAYGYN